MLTGSVIFNLAGFDLFCPGHLMILCLVPVFTAALTAVCMKIPDRYSQILIRSLSVLIFVCELTQDVILTLEGGNILNYLPLHLCNIGIFVNLAASFGKGRIREFFSEVSLTLILPGAAFALITPDWNYRPLLSWLPLMCFFTHSLLVAVPVMMYARNYCRPSFRHFYYPYVFLILAAIPVYFFDKAVNRNYMYLLWPADGSPLEWLAGCMGNPGYLIGALIILAAVLSVIYSILMIIEKAGKRS